MIPKHEPEVLAARERRDRAVADIAKAKADYLANPSVENFKRLYGPVSDKDQ